MDALTKLINENNLDDVLHVLLNDAVADVNAYDTGGNTLLHLAVKAGSVLIVQAFIVFDADLNKKNADGFTPRHLAATSEGDNRDVILHMLDICGAERCAEGLEEQCKGGCSFSGDFNGKPDENSDKCLKIDDKAIVDAIAFADGGTGNGDRVLCLDGGGIRGLIMIQILMEMEQLTGKPIQDQFDLVAGTSTGGILALGIGIGKPLAYIKRLYFKLKDKVFTGSEDDDSTAMDTFLKEEFGQMKMSDIKNPKVIVTGTEVDQFPPKLRLFRSYKNTSNEASHTGTMTNGKSPIKEQSDELIWEAARCTSAAPTYFTNYGGYVDGGLMANNPTLDVLTEINDQNQAPNDNDPPSFKRTIAGFLNTHLPDTRKLISLVSNKTSGTSSGPMCVVSLGCGLAPIIPVKYEDLTIVPHKVPDDIFKFIFNLLMKHHLSEEIEGAKALVAVIINQAITAEGRPVDRSRAWCQMIGVPFSRFDPQLSQEIALGCTDNKILMKMLMETKIYTSKNKESIRKCAEFLVSKK